MQRLTKRHNDELMISDELAEHISNNVCSDNAVEFIVDSLLEKLYEYETLEEQNCLITLPCAVGDTIYHIYQCDKISLNLDGTLWDSDGSYGTATGYYCPYEKFCPHGTTNNTDEIDCETARQKLAIFEDTVTYIFINETECSIGFEYTGGANINDFGKTVFLTRKKAKAALAAQKGRPNT